MATHRLVQALDRIEPSEIDHIFGREALQFSSAAQVNLAPVKRVALFAESFFPKVDGVAKSAYLTLRYLQQTGREVLVFAPDRAPAQVGSSRVIPLRSWGLPFAPETRVALPVRSISQHLDRFRPDLIHLFSPAVMSAEGMWAGRRRHIPVIANYQTDLPAYAQHYGFSLLAAPLQNWLRFIHNGSHLTLVPSKYTLEQLDQLDYRRLRIWRRGVDLVRFDPAHRSPDMRARLLNGRDPASLLCVYVGRVANEKRIDLLRDVATLPGVALTIVGDGAAREDLEKLFAGTGTVFTGYLYGEDLARAYASADVFLFPSPTETFGQVVQEAMASGLPAVVIDQGGVTDLVTAGDNGFLCPAEAPAFATAVQLLRDSEMLRQRMAHCARQIAAQHPWETVMAQLEGYYQEAIELNQRQVYRRQSLTSWLQRDQQTALSR